MVEGGRDSVGGGAKRLAIRSAAQLTTPAAKKSMQRLRQLLQAERLCKLGQGDVLVRLIDRHHLRAIDIARQTKQRPNDLSQMYRTCRMFPPRVRRRDVPYNVYFMAMRMVRKFKHLQLQPADVLNEIQARRFTQHRDVTAHFAAQARAAERRVAAEDGAVAPVAATTLKVEATDRSRAEQGDLTLKVFELSQSLTTRWLAAEVAEKRQMLELICLNFSLDGVTLAPTMRKPFDVLVEGLFVSSSRGDRI